MAGVASASEKSSGEEEVNFAGASGFHLGRPS